MRAIRAISRNSVALAVLAALEVGAQTAAPDSKGRESKAAPPSIAWVGDVDADGAGHVYIADEKVSTISVLNRRLELITVIGKNGGGDGEFRALRSVRATGPASFIAVERYLRRIYFYEWKGDKPALVRTMRLPFDIYDACLLPNGHLLATGLYKRKGLHEVDAQGKVLTSFAPVDSSLSDAVADHASRMRVACSPGGKEAVLTGTEVPLVETVSLPSGTVTKEYLTPIRTVILQEHGRGSEMRIPAQGVYIPGRALFVGNQRLIGAQLIARMDGGTGDSVRWFGYDTTRKSWAVRSNVVGRVFPLGGDTALRVIQGDAVEPALVSMKKIGWMAAAR